MHVLGVDVGTSNTKVSLVLLPDVPHDPPREMRVCTAPTPLGADELVAEVVRLVAECVDGVQVDAVGIASMAETGVPLDADDRPLTELLRWTSGEGEAQARALVRTYGADVLFSVTGVRPAPKSPLVTWTRLASDEPQVWGRMHRWAGAADLVALAMTGQLVTDHTLAGRTMAYVLPGSASPLPDTFEPELLAIANLRLEQLPTVLLPGSEAPRLTSSVFVAAGLPAGVPVVVAGHDHQVGAWAAGVRVAGDVADSVGTAESLISVLPGDTVLDRPAVARAGMSMVRTVLGEPALVAGTATAGALASWWMKQVAAVTNRESVLDTVLSAPPRPDGPVMLPYLRGRQSPFPDPTAVVGVVAGDGRRLPLADLLTPDSAVEGCHALLAGLCLQIRWMAAEQRRLSGLSPSPVTVIGGPGGRGLWPRTKAEILVPGIGRVRAEEPVASGAALLAAQRLGLGPDADGSRLTVIDDPPAAEDRWAAAADRFQQAALSAPDDLLVGA